MKSIYYFSILALISMKEQKSRVTGSTDKNSGEPKYSSNDLDPIGCTNLSEVLRSNSSQYRYVDHRLMNDLMERKCQLEIQKLNRKKNDAQQYFSKMSLGPRRSDSTNYINRNKRFVNILRSFIRTGDIEVKSRLMPLIFASRRFDSSLKINDGKTFKVETGNQVTSRVLESHTTVCHEVVTTTQSIVNSVPIEGTDERIAQLTSKEGKEQGNGDLVSNLIGGMSSSRWVAFIIFLLFIILTMFATAMITIYKNREKDGRHRRTIVKRECDDNCPLMDYSSMSPDVERGWTTSATDLTTLKPQRNPSITSSQWRNTIQDVMEEMGFDNSKKSKIVMKDEQEQTNTVMKKPKSKVKRAKLQNMKPKRRKKYETREHRMSNDISVKERIINSLRRNKHNCKCCDCDRGKNDDIGTVRDRYKDYEEFKVSELNQTSQDAATETEDTSKQLEKQQLLNKTERIRLKSPRLSFPMACTNKDCNETQLSGARCGENRKSNFK